jgi:hypothetical protein
MDTAVSTNEPASAKLVSLVRVGFSIAIALVGLALIHCSTNVSPNAGLPPTPSVDASVDVDHRFDPDAYVPSYRGRLRCPIFETGLDKLSTTPDACVAWETCRPSREGPPAKIFTAPSGVVLKEAASSRLLAFDENAKQFIIYAVGQNGVQELTRVDPQVDRVLMAAASSNNVYCRATECQLQTQVNGREVSVDLPAGFDVRRLSSDGCLIGNGVMCFDSNRGDMVLEVKPNDVRGRIHDVLWLPTGLLVATDQELRLLYSCLPPDIVSGKEEVLRLERTYDLSSHDWVGEAKSGNLVRGSGNLTRTCQESITLTPAIRGVELLYQSSAGPKYVGSELGYCTLADIPTGTRLGAAGIGCGTTPFFFDSHDVFIGRIYRFSVP